MRYQPGHKQKSSLRILQAAASLFRKRGYSATGVDAVMAAVDLTAGSFYSHFRSKEELLAQALDSAFEESRGDWPKQLQSLRGPAWVREFASFYLSPGHRDAPEKGCPMPALTPEIHRMGDDVRGVFERRLAGLIAAVEEQLDESSRVRGRAISAIALCVGGLQLARAVTDSTLSNDILGACSKAVADVCASEQRAR